jgi:hypothetical protein
VDPIDWVLRLQTHGQSRPKKPKKKKKTRKMIEMAMMTKTTTGGAGCSLGSKYSI